MPVDFGNLRINLIFDLVNVRLGTNRKYECKAKKFWHPQKAQLLMLKHIMSKDEAPTPKGGWVMAGTTFCLKNRRRRIEVGQIQ